MQATHCTGGVCIADADARDAGAAPCLQVLYPGTYAQNLDGCHVEMGCLGQLLQQKQPSLAAHLQVSAPFQQGGWCGPTGMLGAHGNSADG